MSMSSNIEPSKLRGGLAGTVFFSGSLGVGSNNELSLLLGLGSTDGIVSLLEEALENKLARLEAVVLGSATAFFPTSDLKSERVISLNSN